MKRTLSILLIVLMSNVVSSQVWTNQTSAISGSLNTVSCIDSFHACVGGDNSPNLAFTLNGNTWNTASTSCTNSIVSAQCITQHTFVAASDYTYGGSFYKSTDGGSSFNCTSFPSASGAYATCNFHPIQVVFLDSLNGYVCGYYSGVSGGGTADHFGQILKTTNGGSSWQQSLIPHYNVPGIPNGPNIGSVNSLYFFNTQNGIAFANNDSLYKTNDGGATWTNFYQFTNGQNPNSIYFQTTTKGWAACANGVLLSTFDGGNSWSRTSFPPTDNYLKTQFTDSLHGWLLGNTSIYKSCDGGSTWAVSQNFNATMHDFCMLNNSVGYAVGDGANIFKYSCNPSTITLNRSICANESYSVGTSIFHNQGDYDIMMQGTNCGCDSVVHLHLIVHNLPTPNITFSNGTYSTGIFSHYQWLYNGVALTADTMQFVSPSFVGNYSVMVTDANGCVDTSTIVTFTSIDNLNKDLNVSVYPNPSKDHLCINLSESDVASGYSIRLTNLLGQVLIFSPVSQKSFSIDLTNFSSSEIYNLSLLNKSGTVVFSKKIVLE